MQSKVKNHSKVWTWVCHTWSIAIQQRTSKDKLLSKSLAKRTMIGYNREERQYSMEKDQIWWPKFRNITTQLRTKQTFSTHIRTFACQGKVSTKLERLQSSFEKKRLSNFSLKRRSWKIKSRGRSKNYKV